MRVDDDWSCLSRPGTRQQANGLRKLTWIGAAAQQGSRSASAAHIVRPPLENGVLDPRRGERPQLQIHGALLTAPDPIAVVHYEHARACGHRG